LPPRWRRWRPAVWPEPQGEWRGAAEAGAGGGVAEAAGVAGVRDHCRSYLRAGALQVSDWLAVLGEQLRDLGVERGAAPIEVLDLAGELSDAAGRDVLDEAVTETAAPASPQFALAGQVEDARLADRVDLIPVGAQPLDRLGAVADEAAALQLEQRQRRRELGLQCGSELRAFAR
jgi:hypothetical protein